MTVIHLIITYPVIYGDMKDWFIMPYKKYSSIFNQAAMKYIVYKWRFVFSVYWYYGPVQQSTRFQQVPADVVTLFVQLLVGFSAVPQWSSAPAARLTSEKKEGRNTKKSLKNEP